MVTTMEQNIRTPLKDCLQEKGIDIVNVVPCSIQWALWVSLIVSSEVTRAEHAGSLFK